MENLIELLKKIITNVLTALYQPFWFAVILTVFLLFFYLYAYKPIDTGKGIRAAHTLKGVCINLGFDRLYNVSAELTEKLRGREIEESEELFEQVEKEYRALTAVLKQYESEL